MKIEGIKPDRLPFIVLALSALVAGLGAGLSRIGWSEFSFHGMIHHGGIMVGGFLGTLITLEKIIPLKKRWLYVFPVLSACSVVAFLIDLPKVGFIMLLLSSAGLSLAFLFYLIRNRELIYTLMLLGAVCWLVGNYLMISNQTYPSAIGWWMAFALFVIAAERIELMKFLPVSRTQKLFFTALLLLFVTGCLVSFHGIGGNLAGLSLVSVSLWLMKNDLVGITIRKTGLPRYSAAALLSGYVSMLLSGVLILTMPNQAFAYDIFLHTFFIGFVFSMIFAHGPIILPGVVGSSTKPYHPSLYIWLVLLQISWIARTAGGLLIDIDLRRISGLLSAVSILGYFITLVVFMVFSIRSLKSTKKNINFSA